MRVADLEAIRIKLASPEDIMSWSHGEVTKPETINYRTQKPEKDGLFDEKIFGPEKDYECYCGKYRGIRHKGIVCDKCGVEVTKSQVRRERMGHIKLASPVSHIWFLRGIPSRIGQILDLPMSHLEKVIYFNAYIVTKTDESAKKSILEQIDKEYSQKLKALKNQKQPAQQKGKKQDKQDKQDKEDEKELKSAKDRAKEELQSLKVLKILSEVEYFDLSLKYGQCFEAGTGGESLRKIFSEIDLKKKVAEIREEVEQASPLNRKKLLRRIKLFQGMEKANIRPEWMFMTVLPVLPPDLRPMVQLDGGRYASSDLNDLYRRVINRNNRLKYLLEIGAPEVIIRNEKRMLQEAVDALIDNGMRKGTMTQSTTGGRRLLKSLADILKGKQGRFRQNLLGKRVDYSGRSVIVVGPELLLYQVGLPKKMALELFKPFVIKKILDQELAYNVRGASRLIEQETDDVWAILEQVVMGKTVLLNRAPTLHRLGIQAFKPILIEGEAIRVHPLVCKAFNADFDGDQMAVHLPLSAEAQEEAVSIMLSSHNLLKPATGLPIVSPTQDIVLGCYWFTKILIGAKGEGKIFGSAEEALLAHEFDQVDINAQIKIPANEIKGNQKKANQGEFFETSVGRLIFNQDLPDDFPFQNQTMNSKKIEEVIREVIEKYGIEFSQPVLDKIKSTGFDGATRSGISWGMDDLQVPLEKPKLIEQAEKQISELESHFQKGFLSKKEKYQRSVEVWQKTKSEIEKLVPKALPEGGSVFTIIDSGSRGSWSQPVQMAGMKGLVINPVGRIIELPIKNSYKEGFDVLEYFLSTHGARKGTADTALRTSTAGYLTRRLVDVGHEVIVFENDCGDTKGILFSKKEADMIGQNFLMKIVSRIAADTIVSPDKKVIVKKGQAITWQLGKEIIDAQVDQVLVRSPLSCKLSRGICQKCYGWDLGSGDLAKIGDAVGVIAAQAIGEPGTQLTMRTFHTGGVASSSDITLGLPRVEEIFETRVPAGQGIISQVKGQVLEVIDSKLVRIKPDPDVKAKKSKTAKSAGAVIDYEIPAGKGILVKAGDEIEAGQALCEGNLDLKELFKVIGEEKVRDYIIREIQNIYVSQGASIHDKHLEVIVRQMFSKMRIKDAGDSHFIQGEVVSKTKLAEENDWLKKEGKKQILAVPVLLGISKVALATDSFLSAASFIETSRVLIKAAIEGKEDKLQGLKENVIIGKLIPAGTGFKK